jgi:hypothetical protein
MAHGRFNKRLVQIELPSAQKAPENIAGECRTLPDPSLSAPAAFGCSW